MPAPRKIFVKQSVILVTSRTEEDLPFIPIRSINHIIRSVLAAANVKYPVRIVGFNFEANHFHIVLLVQEPGDVPLFVGYVKQETAHRINRLLGRRGKTVWAERYDSPVILDSYTALEKISYTLCNPIKDDLCKSLDEYPGVSSWVMFRDETFEYRCKAIPRDKVPSLKDPERAWKEDDAVADAFEALDTEELTLEISPYEWKSVFSDTKDLSDEEIRGMMMEAINKEIAAIGERREREKKTVFPSAESLRRQSMLKCHRPKKHGKRMLCLAVEKATRIPFIAYVKKLIEKAAESADPSVTYPPGLYRPGAPPIGFIVYGAWASA